MNFHKLEEFFRAPQSRPHFGAEDFPGAQLVRQAQKFYGGDTDNFSEVKQQSDKFPRLPYRICSFEFNIMRGGNPRRTFFVFALESKDLSVQLCTFFEGPRPGKEKTWIYAGGVCVDKDRVSNTLYIQEPYSVEHEADIKERIKAACGVLLRFLTVLNCTNVEIAEIPAPKFLNKKRIKKGKLPLYTYKTLVLKTRQQRFINNGYGTHDSPRIHLRRGHIKRRKTGNFWWEPHVVGDKSRGVVVKDYKVEESLSAIQR